MVAFKGLFGVILGYLVFSSDLVSADGLNARAKAKGRYWGTCINPSVMNDGSANAIASNGQDFGSYTAENEMKFDALEPSRGNFNYGNADRIVSQAKANGMHVRCHALIWHSQVPSWVANGGFNRDTLISIMNTHIQNVVTHFKGKRFSEL
jgi:endo-1,4-beta-xylanase